MRSTNDTASTRKAPVRLLRRGLPVLALAAATLVGGCVYNPYNGTYQPGIVAAPGYYAPGYAPGYAYAPAVVIGGGYGGYRGGYDGYRGGGYWRR